MIDSKSRYRSVKATILLWKLRIPRTSFDPIRRYLKSNEYAKILW